MAVLPSLPSLRPGRSWNRRVLRACCLLAVATLSAPLPRKVLLAFQAQAPGSWRSAHTAAAKGPAVVAGAGSAKLATLVEQASEREEDLQILRRFATSNKPKSSGKGFGASTKPQSKSGSRKESGESSSKSDKGSFKWDDAKKATEPEASRQLVRDKARETSSELTTTKLEELRERTLAQRRQREADLDEYEEGLATIAKYGPSAAVMPEKVAERAGKRGIVLGGSFYFAMIAVFGLAIGLSQIQEIIIPPTLVAFVTLILLVLAVVGGSYGMMSASWDEDREGSVLGTKEFARNMGIIGDGFRKGVLQEEYEKAIATRRENRRLLAAKEEKKRELLNE